MVTPKREKFLYYALKESLNLQCHYAKILNMYDGGQRIDNFTFKSWLERLIKIHGKDIEKSWIEAYEEIKDEPSQRSRP